MDTLLGVTDKESVFRERLLRAMAEEIRERAFRDTRIPDIVRRAQTSMRTFYEMFGSREECFLELMRQVNDETMAAIAEAVDPSAHWESQVEQAINAWVSVSASQPEIARSAIRDLPSLGEQGRRLQRQALDDFATLVETVTSSAGMRASGVAPPSRQLIMILLGGLRELIAMAIEDDEDLSKVSEAAIIATKALARP
ncbi:TetR/AcrR family transcriptional regulator [Mycobacteroides abscessus]|nr:TetR/AcrR family transcriptional regulator [Mycobacteroides abscessus]RIS83586.1 TetR/AcrR family transcriptional regulator [Mycobacteroides abscessus]